MGIFFRCKEIREQEDWICLGYIEPISCICQYQLCKSENGKKTQTQEIL